MARVLGSLKALFAGKRVEKELDDEIRFHVERETEENVRRGMAPETARTEALRKFGGVEKTKEEVRETDRAVLFETILQDVRYGLRALRRNPGYAAAAVLTLALGIGANTAIFSVVHGVILQSLPYGGGDRLVRIQVDAPGAGIEDGAFAPLEIADLQNLSRSFFSDRRVPLDVVRSSRPSGAGARADGRRVGALLRPHGREAHPRARRSSRARTSMARKRSSSCRTSTGCGASAAIPRSSARSSA